MLIPNRFDSIDDYRYGFNGMENDREIKGEGNSYDFGARLYDPRIGRWFSPDPLEYEFPSFSTYSFALNNPIYIIDIDGKRPDPIIVKYIQTAINNMPKINANKEFQELRQRVYGESKNIVRIAASLNDKKYLYKGGYKGIIKNHKYEAKTSLNFYGLKVNVYYSLSARDDLSKFNIVEFDWKGNKEGPYVYGAGGPGGVDQNSGYYLEMNNSIKSNSHTLLTLQFDDFESMEKAKNLYVNEYKKELEKLLNTDPLIREYLSLLDYQQEKVYPIYEKLIKDPKNEMLKKEYSKALESYKKRTKEFDNKRKKVLEVESKRKKNG